MALYFESYSMKEKLWEYAELSTKKKALGTFFKNTDLTKKQIKLLNKLESGDLNNIIDIGKIVDEILTELE